jgi:methyl-accepting chemotaxis protein
MQITSREHFFFVFERNKIYGRTLESRESRNYVQMACHIVAQIQGEWKKSEKLIKILLAKSEQIGEFISLIHAIDGL